MLPYLLKRLLYALPTLWLIASLVFLLSRLLPGTFASEIILQESSGLTGGGSVVSRQNAYNDFLRRTGQDLPLFYVSLQAALAPDAAAAGTSSGRQLEKLTWLYGDQHLAAAYLQSIISYKNALPVDKKQAYQQQLEQLYAATKAYDINTLLLAIPPGTGSAAATSYNTLQQAATQLTAGSTSYGYLVPALKWHGTGNQYHQWLVQLLQGNLGQSFKDGRAVTAIIAEAVGNTIIILLVSMVLAVLVAFYLSLLLVRRKFSALKKIALPALFVLDSIPSFVLALLLLVLLASPAFLQAFPVFGLYSSGYTNSWWQELQMQLPYLVLPVICLTLANLPYLTNQLYRSLSDASFADYAKTAKAKGLSEGKVVRKHLLRNALLPFITVLSDFLPLLVAGAVVIEAIFAIPGMGTLLISSVLARDHTVLVAIVITIAAFKILSLLLADLLYRLADPRIQLASS